MSIFRRFAMAFSLIATVSVTGFAWGAPADATSAPARMDTYAGPDGKTYFALSLSPSKDVDASEPRDLVVLFDTSASQVGAFREKSFAALDSLLAGLEQQDRVRLIALDLNATPLTETFVAPDSPELKAGIAKLKKRIPLGSTDMTAGLSAVVASYADPSPATRAAVYIGDGMSKANLMDVATFEKMVVSLTTQRIPVSSYAVGMGVDSQFLAALANQTGGNLAVARSLVQPNEQDGVTAQRAREENLRESTQAGMYLADAVRGTVLWPVGAEFPAALKEVFPKLIPPLRNDRDTVLIGTADLQGPLTLKMTVEAAGRTSVLTWDVTPNASNEDQAYLDQLVNMASRDGGLLLTTVGTAGLVETKRMLHAGVKQLTNLAERALATGNTESAGLLADEALRRDPGNPLAQAIHRGAQRGVSGMPARGPAGPNDLRLVKAQVQGGEALEAPDALELGGDGSFLNEVGERNRVIIDMTKAEVASELEDARDRMSSDPQSVIQNLKLLLEHVKRLPELDSDTRFQLVDQLESGLKEAAQRGEQSDNEQRVAQEAEAQRRERQRIVDRLTRDQQKIKQLMDRMSSLIDEGRYVEAEEGIGPELAALDDGPTTVAAVLTARSLHYNTEQQATRVARHKGFIDTMMQIEYSSIPFPDEPPIVYPDADVWEELSLRRRKFASVDLKARGSTEEKITQALEGPTSVEFIETPLTDVVEYLKDAHDIEIQLDPIGLKDEGIGTDTPVTLNLKGISLRSALRLMLRRIGGTALNYMIRDEVLLITSQQVVENELTTKVYPVADLVLPIPQNMGQGGFGGGAGGGMLGGGGMGGGGGGGMGGGMGGGGMGGGGGGGGGFFNVADENAPAPKASTSKPKTLKLFKAPATEVTPVAATKEVEVKSTADSPADLAAPEDDSKVADVKIGTNSEPAEFWNDFFASGPQDQAVVRKAVRNLLAKRQLDHVSALCQAALVHGQPQPWIYETLGLAMEADTETKVAKLRVEMADEGKSPQAIEKALSTLRSNAKIEIERALMSAADFADSPDTLMYLAQYLSRLGLDARALQLYRQVTRLDPLSHDAYAQALLIASERLDDLEAIKWATVGALSQAWPAEQLAIRNTAFRTAKATLDRLQKERRTKELAEYQAQLDNAMIRDCVVRVSWTGDADVDLIIEEPTGTVCSLRTPRTTSGGVILGSAAQKYGEARSNEHSETYSCPQGFSGDYRVILRRVWGKLAAGKVTVDVYTNYRSQKPKHERQQISLGQEDAIVEFNLEQGRRQEALAEQQIAQAAKNVEVSRAVLAQQLNSVSDPRVAAEIARTRELLDGGRGLGNSAVGFQPVIIFLNDGTNFQATAVISADRRYVRITSSPIISRIGNVSTFTFAGGANQVMDDMIVDGADANDDNGDLLDANP